MLTLASTKQQRAYAVSDQIAWTKRFDFEGLKVTVFYGAIGTALALLTRAFQMQVPHENTTLLSPTFTPHQDSAASVLLLGSCVA